MAYWIRTGPDRFTPTEHVGGAWNESEQHIAPALGLLVHAVELDRDARDAGHLRISRLSYDIWGAVPLAEMSVAIDVVRPGRSIELVRATASYAGRVVVELRAWLLATYDTQELTGSDLPPVPGPDRTPAWEMSSVWPGGFIASTQVRRQLLAPGRSVCWVRTAHELVADEPVSRTAAVAGLLDITNGISPRVDPRRVAFPNVDLTAHLLRDPAEGWLGFDLTVSFGPDGRGVTSSVLHDESGPLGTSAQTLTVRP